MIRGGFGWASLACGAPKRFTYHYDFTAGWVP